MSIAFLSAAWAAMRGREPLRAHAHAAGLPAAVRYRSRSRDRLGDRVRHEVPDRPPVGDAPADVRGRDVDPRHVEERHALAAVQRLQAPGDVLAADALALGDGEPSQRQDGLGLAPRRQALGHVASDDEGQLVLRFAAHAAPSGYRPCTTAPAVDLQRRHAEALVAGRPPAGTARRARAGPGSSRASLCGGTRDRHQHHAVEARAGRAPPARRPGGPMCGGLNVPPRMPM